MSLFEIVDTTNDEVYYTLAVYDDFETAKSELLSRDNKDYALTEHGSDDEFEKIEIREHKVGWGKGYKTIFKLMRSKDYNQESDEFEWNSEYA